MNEPLKLKLHSVYGQILVPRKMNEAWLQVKRNNGCGGVDKISIKDFEKNSNVFIEEIIGELRERSYKSSPVRRKYIPKKNGKLRPLGIPTIKDRVIQQALVNVLSPFCEEKIFHNDSCGFRPNRDTTLAVKKILWRIETGHTYVYDFDIKGFFDNIPHKKLMKVISKYIADGTVLDLIWKWLKAGYMEDEIKHESERGTMQGGVISPLIANLYLNELDWELEKAGIAFVRYADDALLFAKSKEDIQKAIAIVNQVFEELELELEPTKTRVVDFEKEDFDFLGYTFFHWRKRVNDDSYYYTVGPSRKTTKKFREDIKAVTKKSCTFSHEKWRQILNPKIRGKVNYILKAVDARNAVDKALEERGFKSRCVLAMGELANIDAYIRQRLRIALVHKNPNRRKGHLMKLKFSNKFFLLDLELVSGEFMLYNIHGTWTLEQYADYKLEKGRKKHKEYVRKLKEKGQEYYTQDRLRKIQASKAYV